MSIILKGIDMPKCSNEDILVVIRRDKAEVWQTGYKERTVEAIQIPKGHGDIKDVGKIDIPSTCVDMFENCGNCNLLDDEQVKEIIHNAPTILEAEE